MIRPRTPRRDIGEWHPWFAWRPVATREHWIWLERVERRYVIPDHIDFCLWAMCAMAGVAVGDWEYRLPLGGGGR